jgi:hypothetical protein
MMFRNGAHYRIERSMPTKYAVKAARSDGMLPAEAIDLWVSFLDGEPLPWHRDLVPTFHKILNSPYVLISSENDGTGMYFVAVIRDHPYFNEFSYWGPSNEGDQG